MITRAERLDLFSDAVPERRCPLCSHLPRVVRPAFRETLCVIPIKGTCLRCLMAFWNNITVFVDSQEELDALRQAIREERQRGNPRPNGHELLKEIRARKVPTKH